MFGHVAGDRFLIEFARRLEAVPLDATLRIRVAGDEFALFVHGLDSVDDERLHAIWQLIEQHVLAEPIVLDEAAIPVSVSAGMAVYGVDTTEICELLEFADFAMYQAKRRGRNQYCRFERAEYEQKTAASRHKSLES